MNVASSYSICGDLGSVFLGGVSHSQASERAFSRDHDSQDGEARTVSALSALGRMKLPMKSLGRLCYLIGRGTK